LKVWKYSTVNKHSTLNNQHSTLNTQVKNRGRYHFDRYRAPFEC